MSKSHKAVVIVGSLRKNGFSLQLANVLAKMAPDTLKLEVVTLEGSTFYDPDLETTVPADWAKLRSAVSGADGVILISPEYNRAPSGVMKNAIDILSRPYGKGALLGKAVAIVTSSPGTGGGMAASMQLKQILPGISGPLLQQPEMYLNGIGNAFNESGELAKEDLKQLLDGFLQKFAAHVARNAG